MWGVNRFSLKPPQLIQTHQGLPDQYQMLQKPWKLQSGLGLFKIWGTHNYRRTFQRANERNTPEKMNVLPSNSNQPLPLRLKLASILLLTDNKIDSLDLISCSHWGKDSPCWRRLSNHFIIQTFYYSYFSLQSNNVPSESCLHAFTSGIKWTAASLPLAQ